MQIETIGKKVTPARIPYNPAPVGPRVTSSEPPTKKTKAWDTAHSFHKAFHIEYLMHTFQGKTKYVDCEDI